MRAFVKSRIFQGSMAFLAGGLVTFLFLQEKIITRTKVVEVEVEKIVEVEKEVIREVVVEKEKIVHERIKVVKRKEIYPDGTIIETEIFESESEQIDRLKQEESEKYTLLLAEQERKHSKEISKLKIHTNPKRLNVFAGISVLDLPKKVYLGGFTYPLWGPITVGVTVTSDGMVAPTLGFRF